MSGRIRTLKPEWLEDEALGRAGDPARILSVALMLVADDYGRGRAAPEWLASQAWPYDPAHGLAKVREGLRSLLAMRYVVLYEVDGQSYYEIRNWGKHQRVDKPGKPRIPLPSEATGKVPELLAKVPAVLAPDHDHDPDLDQDPERDPRARADGADDEPGGPPSPPWLVVARAYKARWERSTKTEFPHAANRSALEAIAAWAEKQAATTGGDLDVTIDRLLDRYWPDPWATEKRWPLGHLSRNAGKYYTEVVAGPDPRVEQLRAQLRDLGTMDMARSAKLRAELAALKGTG